MSMPGNFGGPPAGGAFGQPPTGGAFGAAAAAMGTPPARDYEFSDVENQTIQKAATWGKGLAIVMFVQAALGLLNCNIIGAIVNLVTGIFFLQGAQSLKMVVMTEGNDVFHMMQALQKISTAFLIRIVVIAIAAVLLIGVLLLVGGAGLFG